MDAERILATNRNGWDHVAPSYHGRTALPEYGPLALTEENLHLLDGIQDVCALELGCGNGYSLRSLVGTRPGRRCNEISKRGGPPGDRTRDTVIKSHVLYH